MRRNASSVSARFSVSRAKRRGPNSLTQSHTRDPGKPRDSSGWLTRIVNLRVRHRRHSRRRASWAARRPRRHGPAGAGAGRKEHHPYADRAE
jgi:hypothetical protein